VIPFPLIEIPDDPPRDVEYLLRLNCDVKQERQRILRQYELMEHKLHELLRRLCGPRSERFHPDQLPLFFDELLDFGLHEEPPAESEEHEIPMPKRKSKGHGRRRLKELEELPRRQIVHDRECDCETCGKPMIIIGEEITEKLDYEPAQIFVLQERRIKRACEDCEDKVIIATKPAEALPKCLASNALVAQIVTNKYVDSLPLYRQETIFRRMGVEIPRSTMCDWIGSVAKVAEPVVDFMTLDLLRSEVIHTDDTSIPVLDPRLPATRRGRLWVYIGDPQHPQVVFDYTPTRKRDGPAHFLKNFLGYLQADAYAGYDCVFATGNVYEVACWSHARRKFYDLVGGNAKRMTALLMIQQLYQIERLCASMERDQRRVYRQEHSRPVLNAFKEWMGEQLGDLRPKSPLAQALGYALNQWDALIRYTEDGILSIDNNLAERTLRQVAIGRKNWMFAGSDEGARRAAIILSLAGTCKHHGADPAAYFRFLLDHLPSLPVEELTPLAWIQAQAPMLLAA